MKHLTMITEITTKGMTATKISFNNFNHPYLSHYSPKAAAPRLFKEVSK